MIRTVIMLLGLVLGGLLVLAYVTAPEVTSERVTGLLSDAWEGRPEVLR